MCVCVCVCVCECHDMHKGSAAVATALHGINLGCVCVCTWVYVCVCVCICVCLDLNAAFFLLRCHELTMISISHELRRRDEGSPEATGFVLAYDICYFNVTCHELRM